MGGVAVFGDVERVGHRVVLGLESDFDDFHGCDDHDCFGYSGAETGEEDASGVGAAGGFLCEDGFVEFKGGESDGHFRDDAGDDGCGGKVRFAFAKRGHTSETLVKSEERFLLYYSDTHLNKIWWFHLGGHVSNKFRVRVHTPGNLARRLSCIRT